VNLDAVVDSEKLQASPNGRMLDYIVLADILDFCVGDATVVFEKRRQPATGDEAALVDGGRQYRSPVLAVPNRVIGTTSEKGDAKRSTSNDHVCSFPCVEVKSDGASSR
jgi:hypothetical protein